MKKYILGAGAHGRVVADNLISRGETVNGFLDDNSELWGQMIDDIPVVGGLRYLATLPDPAQVIVALGVPPLRLRLTRELAEMGHQLLNAIHASAIMSPTVKIGVGNCICAGVVLNSSAVIEDAVILNTSATIDHDCWVAEGSHLSPGVHLAGRVSIGRLSFLGTGVSVTPRVKIGERSVIAAGAVVVNDIPSNVLAMGVPARVVREIDEKFDWRKLL